MIERANHPAKFHDDLLPIIEQYLVPGSLVLDPMAGSGKIHRLRSVTTWGVEIEPEWAVHHPRTIVGNALCLPFADGTFDAVVTSPVYGNRMSDSHNAQERCKRCHGEGKVKVMGKDGFVAAAQAGQQVHGEVSGGINTYFVTCEKCGGLGRRAYKRLTYKHQLGRDLHPDNSGQMHWGCLAPGHRVLRDDWRWVPVESLSAGDRLIAFDEEVVATDPRVRQRGRRWQYAEVEATEVAERECVEVAFSDGEVVTCTVDHPWLVRRMSGPAGWNRRTEWHESAALRPGDRLPVFMPVWNDDRRYEAGWLAGIFDGEGSWGTRTPESGRIGGALQFAQRRGVVLDKAVAIMDNLGVKYVMREDGRGVVAAEVQGGLAAKASLLGSIRAERLVQKINIAGQPMRAIDHRTVVSVNRVGLRPVVLMGTSTSTYLAEGMGSHNTKYRAFHEAAWAEVIRVLKAPTLQEPDAGRFVLNVKNHLKTPKKGSVQIEQPVIEWHLWTLIEMGMEPLWSEPVAAKGMGFGQNREVRTAHEVVAVLAKPA